MRMPASDLPKSAMASRACSATIGTVIDIAPVEMPSAEDVVHLVAEVAPADVRFPQIRAEVESELEQCEEASKQESLSERGILCRRESQLRTLQRNGWLRSWFPGGGLHDRRRDAERYG